MTQGTGDGPGPDLRALARERPGEVFGAGAADYYTRFREGYPPQLWEHLVARLALDGTQRALDLGCGGGQVTIPLARLAGRTTGLDPSAAMLAQAREAARRAGVEVEWVQAAASDLPRLGLGPVDVVTIGRAFHWMDRAAVLADLDGVVAPDGWLAIMGVGPDRESPAAWAGAVDEVRERFLGPVPHPWACDPDEGHRRALAASPFSDVQVSTWQFEVERDLDAAVGVTFSYSISTPERFGDRAAEFEAELRAALAAAEPSGRYRSTSRAELILARRPGTRG